jgi:RNA 3'-terminal phosphate cyclase (ATP)
MQVVDGNSGGGQVVRAAVTFAALTGTHIRVENARAAREQPGLKAQHVAAIEAVAQLCDAETDGVGIGATTFEFAPGQPRGGEFEVAVGTAGSVTLVFDAVLPLATTLDAPVSIAVTGGTDVAWAPTLDYYRHVKLPLLRRVGVDGRVTLTRRGFYPAGGGRATLHVAPTDAVQPLDLPSRGDLVAVTIRSTASRTLSTAEVAERQASEATDQLPRDVASTRAVEYVESDSPGSVVDLVAEYAHSRAGFSALGVRGKPAEAVARDAVDGFAAFQETDAAVDRHLADQLLPFLALAGGRVRVPAVTDHVETHTDLLRQFGHDIRLDESDGVVLSAPCD